MCVYLVRPNLSHHDSGCQIVKDLALRRNLKFVDYFTIMSDANKQLQRFDSRATIVGPDRVHPGFLGHHLMLHTFLNATEQLQEMACMHNFVNMHVWPPTISPPAPEDF